MLRPRTPAGCGTVRRPAAAAALTASVAAAALAAVPAGPAAATPALPPIAEPWQDTAENAGPMFEVFSPDGSITLRRGGADKAPAVVPAPPPPDPQAAGGGAGGSGKGDGSSPVVAMHVNGPQANRINLVFVGDGYTAREMPTFRDSAEAAWKALTGFEPYKTYQNFFNAQRVEVASPSSGISDDPTDGINRDTPLGMHFWCHNLQRLLCVNTKAAERYGKLADSHPLVVAIAHTTSYGGAGGPVTTLAGENSESESVIVHEMAHTIAALGDEYDVYSGSPGDDTALANASATTADMMVAKKLKWYRWIGKPSADGGTVSAYEGANYYKHGYYRPSVDSEMRTLGKPFNPPSIEALIESFYVGRNGLGSISPIDSATPAPEAGPITDTRQTLSVATVPLVGRGYTVYWAVDGTALPETLGQSSLPLATAPLKKGQWNQVVVIVRDLNPAVSDADFQTKDMTKAVGWWVWGL